MAETKTEGIKMAKASEEDRKALMEFFHELEEMSGNMHLEDIGRFAEEEMSGAVGAGWRRVVFGYEVMLETCCDPELGYLEWKPEIRAMEKACNDARAWAALWKRAAKRHHTRFFALSKIAAIHVAEARQHIAELQATANQAISDLQGVANLSVDSESHDEIVTIVQHVAAQFAEMKEDS